MPFGVDALLNNSPLFWADRPDVYELKDFEQDGPTAPQEKAENSSAASDHVNRKSAGYNSRASATSFTYGGPRLDAERTSSGAFLNSRRD